MWPESSSVNAVNLAKNLLQFQRYRIFPRGLLFLARPVYGYGNDPISLSLRRRIWAVVVVLNYDLLNIHRV